jgi:hypothetical protein
MRCKFRNTLDSFLRLSLISFVLVQFCSVCANGVGPYFLWHRPLQVNKHPHGACNTSDSHTLFLSLLFVNIFSAVPTLFSFSYICADHQMFLRLRLLCLISYTYLVNVDGSTSCTFLVLIILQSVLRQIHSRFQSEFSAQCDLVLPLSIFSILSFPSDHPAAAYAFFLVFSSLLCFRLSFLQ